MRPTGVGFLLAALLPPLAAADKIFYASAVSYCSDARAIVVDKFLLEYDVTTNSITFDISAATVDTDLSANLDFSLVAYGINAINDTISLCDTLGGILCPLPTYDFIGSATIPLPSSISSSIKLPSIAYKIPDLEATAYVRLVSVSDGVEAACLKVDLSNGETTRHVYVSWALGGIALLSLLVGALDAAVNLWKGRSVEEGRRKERLVAILGFFQFVASTGLLSVDYPLVFESYTANFAWCIGLFYITPVQVSIDQTRQRTGGNLTQIAGNLVGGTDALSSKYTSGLATRDFVDSPFGELFARLGAPVVAAGARLAKRASAIAIPNVQETNTLDSVAVGIPRFSTNVGVSPFNSFLTVLVTFLFLLAIFVACVLLLSVPFFFLERHARRHQRYGPDGELVVSRWTFLSLVRANALRVLLVGWFPLLVFTFYQWTIGDSDSWAPIVLSVFTFVFTTGSLVFLAIRTTLLIRREGHESIPVIGGPDAPFWNPFKFRHWWFFLPLLTATFLRAIFISFARGHGWRQTIGLLVIESLVFLAECVFCPFTKKTSNGVNITISIVRIVISGFLITFNESLGLNEIIRVVIGFVILVIESIVVVGLFVLVCIDLVTVVIHAIKRAPALPNHTSDMREVENGTPQRTGSGDSVTLDDGEVIPPVSPKEEERRRKGEGII